MEQTEQLCHGIGDLEKSPWVGVCICILMYMYTCAKAFICVQVHVYVHVCVCRESAKEKGWSVGGITGMNCTLTSIPSLQLLTKALAI